MKKIEDLIIIGSGPAGLTAAIYAARAKLAPLVIEGPNPGGQLISTTYVENWPGEKSILGTDLMLRIKEHATHFGTRFLNKAATRVDFQSRPFKIWADDYEIQAKSVIIATGANPKQLGCPGETDYWSRGVSTCAICDGALYPDKQIVIVGGGDTAMEDALFMTRFTDKIMIIQIEETLTASKIMQDRVLSNTSIKVIYNSTVTKIDGNGQLVTNVLVTNTKTNLTTLLQADAIFIAIGLKPATTIFKDHIATDSYGHIIVENQTKTSIAGVFAAGDVCDRKYRQAITSAGFGCMAALDAEKYLTML